MRFWAFVLPAVAVHAIRIPFEILHGVSHPNALFGRQNTNITNGVPLANTQNAVYISNITLGTRTIPVLVDTGR